MNEELKNSIGAAGAAKQGLSSHWVYRRMSRPAVAPAMHLNCAGQFAPLGQDRIGVFGENWVILWPKARENKGGVCGAALRIRGRMNGMNAEPIDSRAFRGLMRNVAGQVSIVATGALGRRSGLTASAVCSLSDLPPMLLVCINRASSAHDIILENGVFSINVLAEGQEAIARIFAGHEGLRGEERFLEVGDWIAGATGAPLLGSAVCQLECRLSEYHETSTHTVFFGTVIAGAAALEVPPLLYHRGAYTGLRPVEPANSILPAHAPAPGRNRE